MSCSSQILGVCLGVRKAVEDAEQLHVQENRRVEQSRDSRAHVVSDSRSMSCIKLVTKKLQNVDVELWVLRQCVSRRHVSAAQFVDWRVIELQCRYWAVHHTPHDRDSTAESGGRRSRQGSSDRCSRV